MDELVQWFSMGGYSIYVWPAYGLAVLTLVIARLSVKKQKKHIQQQLQRWFKSQ